MNDAVNRYIRRIHNRVKKDYAVAYFDYRLGNRATEPNPDHYLLGAMARQAVRMQIDSFFKAEGSE